MKLLMFAVSCFAAGWVMHGIFPRWRAYRRLDRFSAGSNVVELTVRGRDNATIAKFISDHRDNLRDLSS